MLREIVAVVLFALLLAIGYEIQDELYDDDREDSTIDNVMVLVGLAFAVGALLAIVLAT